jgi:hypothetical protein
MKISLKPNLLPWLTLGLGGIGLALRLWLQAQTDDWGLLPAGHVAQVLLCVLTAVVMAALFFCIRPLAPVNKYSRLFPASLKAAIGCGIGAVGLLVAAIGQLLAASDVLSIAAFVLGLLAAGCLGYLGLCRYKGIGPSYLFYALITVFLMLYTVCQCRNWGSEPQLMLYAFQLLTCIFLVLTGYYPTVLASQKGSRRWFVFCSQSALFFCCVSLAGENKLFFMAMAAWLALDLCVLQPKAPRTDREEKA